MRTLPRPKRDMQASVYTYSIHMCTHTSVFSLSTQHPTPMLRAWPPLLLASNSGHYITVSVDHQGTALGHSPLVAPSSELLCGPAQSLNYGQAKRGILLGETFQFVVLYRKQTGTNGLSSGWKSVIQLSFKLCKKPGGFEAHRPTHTSYIVPVPSPMGE